MTEGTSTEQQPKVLFTITEEHLDTGLRGYPVGHCRTSAVSPDLGVTYVGYTLWDLADLPGEDVVYLLLEKELPTPEQARAFKDEMARRSCSPTFRSPARACSTRSARCPRTATRWSGSLRASPCSG